MFKKIFLTSSIHKSTCFTGALAYPESILCVLALYATLGPGVSLAPRFVEMHETLSREEFSFFHFLFYFQKVKLYILKERFAAIEPFLETDLKSETDLSDDITVIQ